MIHLRNFNLEKKISANVFNYLRVIEQRARKSRQGQGIMKAIFHYMKHGRSIIEVDCDHIFGF